MSIDERINELRNECDNYNRALEALKGLAHEMLWDTDLKACVADGKAFFGRRMHSSGANRIAPSRKLTPDLVGQRTATSGFIVELKASVPENAEHRQAKLQDVQKYDDDLLGWPTPTEKLDTHDVILLIDYPNSEVIKRDIERMLASKQMTCERPFSLVYFSHIQRAEGTWLALHLIGGHVSDPEKQQQLSQIQKMHPENIAANPIFGKVLIYDACPPLPLLMLRLYTAIISDLSEEEGLRLRLEGQFQKTYRLAEMKSILADYCCPEQADPRVPNVPQTAWLKEVVRLWEEMGWATKSNSQKRSFDIVIKKTRREPFEQFLRACADEDCKKKRKRERGQERKQKLTEKIREDNPLFAHLMDASTVERERPTLATDTRSVSGEDRNDRRDDGAKSVDD